MTDITELAQSLKAAAEKATPGEWVYFPKNTSIEYDVGSDESQGSILYVDSGDFTQAQTDRNGEFIALANPANVLALVEALEKAQGMEAYWKTQCRGITDHCEELQARIAELESHIVKPPVHPTVASENLDDETLQELIEFRRTTFEYHSKEGNKVQTIIHGVTLAALRELQERRKADSEPVAEVVSIYGDPEAFGEREIRPLVGIQQMPYGTKLYRHAQPAPVVPEEMTIRDACKFVQDMRLFDDVSVIVMRTWNACRAAMLQELKKSAGTEAICRSDENVQVLHTKSPAQSDCCPAQNHVSPEQNGDTPAQSQGWIQVSEQMPPSRHEVLVGRWWGEKPRWCCKWATYIPGHPDAQSSGWLIPGASWTPTHWMPLPAAPQEVKSES